MAPPDRRIGGAGRPTSTEAAPRTLVVARPELRRAVLAAVGERGEDAAVFGDPSLALQFACARAGRLRIVVIDARVPEERARRLVAALRHLGGRLGAYRVHGREPAPGRPAARKEAGVRLVPFA